MQGKDKEKRKGQGVAADAWRKHDLDQRAKTTVKCNLGSVWEG